MTKKLKYSHIINPMYKNFEIKLIEVQKLFKDSKESIHKAM